MELASLTWAKIPKIVSTKKSKLCVYTSLYPTLSLPSSSSSLLLSYKRGNLVSKKHSASVICNSQLKVEEQDLDAEACELVNGTELKIGEGEDALHAYLFQAVKNNNGAGILLLSDVLGFQDSYTRDFSYRVACNGYNVLVPDLFRGNPWSQNRPLAQYEEWRATQDLNRVAEDIATATKWMVDEFMAEESSTKLGVIGFCFGGSRVLEVLARDHDSVFGTGVSFYGANIDSSVVQNVKVPVLLVAGDNDPLCPADKLNEIGDTIGKSSKVVIFKGRRHGFVHRPESAEEDADAEEAFTIMRNWLHNKLLEKA